jgi:hypothetical protein
VDRVRIVGPALLALCLLLSAVVPARAAAQDDAAYAVWVVDHAQRVIAAMQLPDEFRLADLRDVVETLGELIEEARGVEPPARYATAHAEYLVAMERVDRLRDAFLTVVVTRAPVPELGERAFEAGQSVAAALRDLRLAGVVLPAPIVELFGAADSPAPPAAGTLGAALGLPRRPTTGCAAADCDAGTRLDVRVLARVEAEVASRSPLQRGETILALRVRVENHGSDSYVVRRDGVTLEGADGVRRPLVRVLNGGPELVPPEGLSLGPGESREGGLFFAEPRTVGAGHLRIGPGTGEPIVVTLP